jgi:perosamine synthetase
MRSSLPINRSPAVADVPVRYPVSRPWLAGREREYLLDAFDSGWVSSRGAYVERATREFPPAVGQSAGVPCASGTAALHLAMLALGAGPGDEIIVPNLSYVATANAPLFVGATPVLADLSDDDWAIDPDDVARLVGPRTKGVIAVHLFGVVADFSPLRDFCDRRGLWLVEDCAESLGAPLGPRRPGAWGELSTWSFFGNKVLTSGEGGFVTTASRPDLVRAADVYRTQAVDPERYYFHRHLGFNYRITNLQCALLCAQIESLPSFRTARAGIDAAYEAALAPAFDAGWLAPVPRMDICWLYCALLDEGRLRRTREEVSCRLLARHGIDTRPFPVAMHELPHLRPFARGPLDVSARLARTGLNLPTYVGLSADDIRVVADAFMECLAEAAGA